MRLPMPLPAPSGLARGVTTRYALGMRVVIEYQPTKAEPPAQRLKPGTQLLPLARLAHRKGLSTRKLRAAHILTLAESIAALGLLEPLIVDERGFILAGAHRLAALEVLAVPLPMERRRQFMRACGLPDGAQPLPELRDLADRCAELDHAAFQHHYPAAKVPVHVIEIPAKEVSSLPLAIEAAENAIRRMYNAEEVQALAVRLKEAGYSYRPEGGRPRNGEKAVVPTIGTIIGRSIPQVRRLLRAKQQDEPTWDRAVESFARAASRIQRVAEEANSSTEAKVMLEAARAVLATPTGKVIWARRRGEKT